MEQPAWALMVLLELKGLVVMVAAALENLAGARWVQADGAVGDKVGGTKGCVRLGGVWTRLEVFGLWRKLGSAGGLWGVFRKIRYGLPLKVVSYKDLYGWTMDEIVKAIGLKNNCTFCGVFRRQALDRGAALMTADKLATGHNADDMAETVLLNILRGDIARLSRCTLITTGEDGPIPRCKPFKYTYEKEIVIYPCN
ncbi:Cytoplasmic tRNA 2-thiolation protein 1 [Cinnamomum micranthum f. kanehirae]|uniref:Cytoplasmic tRNA 2-thiolation protein 1 n=1 Tax=Cinnamomum micranthum f. kanehirae TaxID=337451 RepID=A0A3S3R055_9MAGN|nr:Cytoplasmic tRNA 2-thiolation protein 1 [Cinnamomum micranthum f. kanehirae]